jgi:hypothetical protein
LRLPLFSIDLFGEMHATSADEHQRLAALRSHF